MSDKTELLPCPFCGSEVIRDFVNDEYHNDISCAECMLEWRMADEDWNRRPSPDPALRVALERMEAAEILLRDSVNQIEYLHTKFKPTGTGNAIITRIENLLTPLSASPTVEPTPSEIEASLDRFAAAGKEAWAKAPEDAKKLIRQVEPGEIEALPKVECGACGEMSTMRVNDEGYPVDSCPHCKVDGFMHPAPSSDQIETEAQKDGERLDSERFRCALGLMLDEIVWAHHIKGVDGLFCTVCECDVSRQEPHSEDCPVGKAEAIYDGAGRGERLAERASVNTNLGFHIKNLQSALRDGIRLMPMKRMGEWKTVTESLLHAMAVFDRQTYKFDAARSRGEGK